ncbi:MAG TPA: helix-turn-helix domain-containing protein [Bacteroidia bacterium]|nr:helix-turn-helix domain-containing protein [Bacteroidia bacterium]HRH08166.1 helix-turn-helix domain-containing protein [Bacteroidia bacterium]
MKNSQPKKKLTFDNLPDAIADLFEEVADIKNQLENIGSNLEPKKPIEYLARSEVAKMLTCNLSTIHNWCKNGKLKPYGIGSRVYFKRSDIEAIMVPIGIGMEGSTSDK